MKDWVAEGGFVSLLKEPKTTFRGKGDIKSVNDQRRSMTDSITKADILRAVEDLPENATLEDAIERMVFLHKIQRGLQQVEAGETMSLEEVEAYFKQRRAKQRG